MRDKEQAQKREQQILEIALDEFIAKGYYGTSTRQISKTAGISSGLMFHYFESKEKLYHSLITMGMEKMVFDINDAKENPKIYLQLVIENIFNQLLYNPFYRKMFVFIDNAQHTKGIPQESEELLRKHDIILQCIPIIKFGQQMNLFKEGNAHALCVSFFGAVQGIAQEKVRVPDTPLPEVSWLMDIICK